MDFICIKCYPQMQEGVFSSAEYYTLSRELPWNKKMCRLLSTQYPVFSVVF